MRPSLDRVRVALLADNFPPVGGGVSRYYAGLSDAFGEDMSVMSPGVRLRGGRFPSATSFMGRTRQMALASLQPVPTDGFVIAGHPHLAVPAAVRGSQTTGLVVHGGEWSDYPGGPGAVRRIANRLGFVIANSEATGRDWLDGVRTPTLVLRPAIPADLCARGAAAPRFQAGRPLRLLTVSRLVARKRVVEVAQMVAGLIAAGLEIEYRIVGDGPQFSELSRLEGPGIRVLRGVDDDGLARAYDWADVFILCPARITGGEGYEGFGIVYLEAAAFGRPAIATNTGGIPEAVAPNAHWLIEPDDWETVRGLVGRIARHQEDLDSMGVEARRWAGVNLWEGRAEILRNFLRSLPNEGAAYR